LSRKPRYLHKQAILRFVFEKQVAEFPQRIAVRHHIAGTHPAKYLKTRGCLPPPPL
jgi:hypothetical protein